MNPYEAMIRAFEIFQEAGDVGEGITAEHDVITAGPPAELASASPCRPQDQRTCGLAHTCHSE